MIDPTLNLDSLHTDIFNEYGGKFLGLKLILELTKKYKTIKSAAFDAVLNNQFSNLKDSGLINTRGQRVITKISGINDDFSVFSKRGINSSLQNPRLISTARNLLSNIENNADFKNALNQNYTRSVILQAFLPDSRIFVITHSTSKKVSLEVRYLEKYFLIESNYESITHKESTLNYSEEILLLSNFNYVRQLNIVECMQSHYSFNLNTEGFYINDEYHVLQLRNIPMDFINHSLDIDSVDIIYKTKFCYGVFELTVNLIEPNSKYVIWDSNNIPWESEIYKFNPHVLFIRIDNGSHLSHAPYDIPANLEDRNNYKYVYINRDLLEDMKSTQINIVCNGNIAIIHKTEY